MCGNGADVVIQRAAGEAWAEFWNATDDAVAGFFVYSAEPTDAVSPKIDSWTGEHEPAQVFGDQMESEQEQWRQIARTVLAAHGSRARTGGPRHD